MLLPRSLRIIGALLLFMGVSQAAFAQRASNLVYLGQANIDGQRDHDTIMIGREDGRFSSLQLRVENAPITFQRVIVHYSNGTSEELQLRDRIPAGGQTRAIDLRGGDRALNRVEFWYSRTNRWARSQPRVQLYGVNLAQVDNRPRPGADGWNYLGQANVDGQRDHDTIMIGREDGRFSSLQLRVENAPITFQRVIVHYSNGTSEELQLRDRIPAGGQTRAIDLRGGDRALNRVEFWYSRTNRWARSQPRVQLYGANLAQVDNRPRPGADGWDYLGQANVDGLRDRDVITVGRNDGRFRSLQLRVEDAPINFQRVVVHYANGTSEAIRLRNLIPAGSQTRVIDLRGGDRVIRDVEFWYSRTNRWTTAKPKVHLYGR